jgi:hypothetical protein
MTGHNDTRRQNTCVHRRTVPTKIGQPRSCYSDVCSWHSSLAPVGSATSVMAEIKIPSADHSEMMHCDLMDSLLHVRRLWRFCDLKTELTTNDRLHTPPSGKEVDCQWRPFTDTSVKPQAIFVRSARAATPQSLNSSAKGSQPPPAEHGRLDLPVGTLRTPSTCLPSLCLLDSHKAYRMGCLGQLSVGNRRAKKDDLRSETLLQYSGFIITHAIRSTAEIVLPRPRPRNIFH